MEGNKEELESLQRQLMSVKWYIFDDDCSLFDLELEHPVSAQTAKEMTKIDLNHTSFHRKFDGKLQPINFKFRDGEKNKRKMRRVNKLLGMGGIERFIDKEDIDEEDLVSCDSSDSSDTESFSSSSDEEDRRTRDAPARGAPKSERTDVMKERLRETIAAKQAERARLQKKK